jgi:phenylacetate-CoA ligase
MIYENPLLTHLFESSPVAVQNVMASGFGLLRRAERWTPAYGRLRQWLNRSQWLSLAEIQNLQDERLRWLVTHAYANVPFYRQTFEARRLQPHDVKSAADLWKLPVLTKADVRRHYAELQARNVPDRRTLLAHTGGTTGVPLRLRLDRTQYALDHALTDRQWEWAGWRPGQRVVFLRGFTLIPPSQTRAPFWRRDWVYGRIYLSGFHLSREHLPTYIAQLQEWSPCYIAGYPSALSTLARYARQHQLVIPMRAVFTSSETLTPLDRSVIESVFACKVWDRYGAGERLVTFSECPDGQLHQCAEFGIAEVDVDGRQARPGEQGRLLCTGLWNSAMPLIRYDSEDVVAVPTQSSVCTCNRGLPLIGPVEGRRDDVLVTSEGRLMPRAGLDQIYEYIDTIDRCQLVQERRGEIVVKVIPRPGFTAAQESELVRQLRRRIGYGTAVQVMLVNNIPPSASGKIRFIVSRLGEDAAPSHDFE